MEWDAITMDMAIGIYNVISSNTIIDNDLGIYVWTLYDNNTIENNYIRNIQMTNSSTRMGWNIY